MTAAEIGTRWVEAGSPLAGTGAEGWLAGLEDVAHAGVEALEVAEARLDDGKQALPVLLQEAPAFFASKLASCSLTDFCTAGLSL